MSVLQSGIYAFCFLVPMAARRLSAVSYGVVVSRASNIKTSKRCKLLTCTLWLILGLGHPLDHTRRGMSQVHTFRKPAHQPLLPVDLSTSRRQAASSAGIASGKPTATAESLITCASAFATQRLSLVMPVAHLSSQLALGGIGGQALAKEGDTAVTWPETSAAQQRCPSNRP